MTSCAPPLVVDLDGSLLRTDTLHEAIAANLRHPSALFRAASALSGGKASFKRKLAVDAVDTVAIAPLNDAVVALIRERSESGAPVALATGADEQIAQAVASRIPEIGDVFASDGRLNLTGQAKVDVLVRAYGEGGFDYVGNSLTDAKVWDHASRRYLATRRRQGVPRWAADMDFAAVLRDPGPSPVRSWARAIRPHQSLKNLLLFLPLIAAHQFTDLSSLWRALLGFICFCLMASGVYLVNDTLDMRADRLHHRKRFRPIAAGWLSPIAAVTAAAAFTLVSIALAIFLGGIFVTVLLGYAVMTTTYSFWLKQVALVDVIMLALLYMVRIVAGAVATGIALSFWFTGVALFLFLSLALVKRYAEAHRARDETAQIHGRGYSGDDVHAILSLGSSSGLASVLLTAIYIQSESVTVLYAAPVALWLVVPVYFYWIANLWLKAGRGQMHEDPVVFALRDRASVISAATILVLFLVATFARLPGFVVPA